MTSDGSSQRAFAWLATAAAALLVGCRTTDRHQAQADRAVGEILATAQQQVLGHTEALGIETPADTLRRRLLLDQVLPRSGPASLGVHDLPHLPKWPRQGAPTSLDAAASPASDPLRLRLVDALAIGAAGNRDYQRQKEAVYRAALDLDLERQEFRTTFSGFLQTLFSNRSPGEGENEVGGLVHSGTLSLSQKLTTGATVTARLALDLAQLLTQEGDWSRGLLADATVTLPLLRGAGRAIVREPLTQAEREVVYAIRDFERFRQTFAVQMADGYFEVLRQLDEIANAADNYRSLSLAASRSRRLGEAGRLSEIQVNQAAQDELRARSRWVSARLNYARRLDGFKVTLGLPADARVELDPAELEVLRTRLAKLLSAERTPAEPPAVAAQVEAPPPPGLPSPEVEVAVALDGRLDLHTAAARVEDAQRKVVVAADALRAGLTLTGGAAIGEGRGVGSATLDEANLRFGQGDYQALLRLDLPLDRTAERAAYRESLIALESAVRNLQAVEDQVKLDVRDGIRSLEEAHESVTIQAEAVRLAERRVNSTDLFFQAGRAEIRDLLDAQEDLVSAQNALTAALVNYRIAELELERDTGRLRISPDGVWTE